MNPARRNVALLASSQAFLFTNNVTLIAINGLAGYALAPDKMLATLPVTTQVIGSALSTFAASLLMQRIGRRAGFQVGSMFGLAGGALATWAIAISNFWLLCLGTMILGVYGAFGLYYRFAAADSAEPEFKAKAISLVVAGGLVGGLIGPELSKWTRALTQPEFLASYASLMVFCVLSMALHRLLHVPDIPATAQVTPPRPLPEILRQPGFIVATMSSAIGYGVMNLLMTATPLAMGVCGHPYSAAATVISAHVVAMFLPSFFTGSLIQRFGVLTIMVTGVAIMFACVAIALAGIDVAHFWLSLVLLGIGWNFMYVGGTTLLTDVHHPNEKAKTQGMHDLLVFGVTAISSFSSGVILNSNGWQMLNYTALPFLVLAGTACLWLMRRQRYAVA